MSYSPAIGGKAHIAVIRAIQAGAWTHRAVIRSLNSICSGETAINAVRRMENEGLIGRKRGGWHVTAKGQSLLPIAQLPPMTPYRTPKGSPMRPGAMDFGRLPSMAAGQLREHRHG